MKSDGILPDDADEGIYQRAADCFGAWRLNLRNCFGQQALNAGTVCPIGQRTVQ
jgi:hypothetical protein